MAAATLLATQQSNQEPVVPMLIRASDLVAPAASPVQGGMCPLRVLGVIEIFLKCVARSVH